MISKAQAMSNLFTYDVFFIERKLQAIEQYLYFVVGVHLAMSEL